jgi:hypothetical protein
MLVPVLDLGEVALAGVPGLTGTLRSIQDLSIGWKLQYLHLAEAVGPRPLRHQLSRGMKSLRAPLAMKSRQAFQVSLGGFAADLVGERCHDGLGEQGRRLRRRHRCTRPKQAADQCPISHGFPCLMPRAARYRAKGNILESVRDILCALPRKTIRSDIDIRRTQRPTL